MRAPSSFAIATGRAPELGPSSPGLPALLQELAHWLPAATLEALLDDLEELAEM